MNAFMFKPFDASHLSYRHYDEDMGVLLAGQLPGAATSLAPLTCLMPTQVPIAPIHPAQRMIVALNVISPLFYGLWNETRVPSECIHVFFVVSQFCFFCLLNATIGSTCADMDVDCMTPMIVPSDNYEKLCATDECTPAECCAYRFFFQKKNCLADRKASFAQL